MSEIDPIKIIRFFDDESHWTELHDRPRLLDFVSELEEQARAKDNDHCDRQLEWGFAVGFVYGNIFDLLDPEAKKTAAAIKALLVKKGVLNLCGRDKGRD